MDPRLTAVARNEALLREVNRQIEALSSRAEGAGSAPDARVEFLCECGSDCGARLQLTLAEYDAAHEQDDRFVVAPGHVTPRIERCVFANDRYAIVDKLPVAEPLVGADGIPSSDGPG